MRHMRLFVLFTMLILNSVDATAKSTEYHFTLALPGTAGSGAVRRLCTSAKTFTNSTKTPRKQPARKAKQPVIRLIRKF